MSAAPFAVAAGSPVKGGVARAVIVGFSGEPRREFRGGRTSTGEPRTNLTGELGSSAQPRTEFHRRPWVLRPAEDQVPPARVGSRAGRGPRFTGDNGFSGRPRTDFHRRQW